MSTICFEFSIGYFLVAMFLWALCVAWIFCKISEYDYIPEKKRHNWKSLKIFTTASYCSICETLVLASGGIFCDSCGICCHLVCTKLADKKLRCKEKYVKNGNPISHLWIKGNLPLNCECEICKDDIDYRIRPGLFGVRCCWCQRTFHSTCFRSFPYKDELCDFGEFNDMIISPAFIRSIRNLHNIKMHLDNKNLPVSLNWKPLIVIASTKSGSNTGSSVCSLLRGILHPLQVIELGSKGPQEPLQWCLKISPRPTRVLVAGGDGTIGWVLNTIFALGIKPLPEVAIMPFGTGNDLSRVMGWGSSPSWNLDPRTILNHIRNAKCVNLDRWVMEIETPRYHLPIQRAPLRTVYIYNYFSIGVDALVTLNFHNTRETSQLIFNSRFFNKLIYFGYGTQQIVQRDCENIQKRLELYLDDKLIEIPELQSIIFLNIDSWGAGVKLCELSGIYSSISDGIMEVFGVVSSFHIAQLTCGISRPVRLGQAKQVKIKLYQPCPVQADGEPWLQPPSEIRLQARGQAKMLKYDAHNDSVNNITNIP